jgi:putative peptidoglycan lipid II flippase
MVLSEPIVRLLFEHGAFTAADTAATAQALTWLSLGLPAHVLAKALSPAFYARHDTRMPLWAALIGFVVALGLAASLRDVWGASGIAAGLAAGATATAAFLLVRAAATPGWSLDPAARMRLPRILLAAALMGALLWLAVRFIAPPGLHGGVWPALVLLGLVAAAMAVYLLSLRLLGVVIWGKAFRAVLQHRSSGDLRG